MKVEIRFGYGDEEGSIMDGLTNVLLIVALFILRLGVPVLITVAIGYLLMRLDAKWQAENEQATKSKAEQPAQRTTVEPATLGPLPLLSLSESTAAGGKSAGGVPCWVMKGCSEAMQARCAAPRQPQVPCWQARTTAEGRLPVECKTCSRFQSPPAMWMAAPTELLH